MRPHVWILVLFLCAFPSSGYGGEVGLKNISKNSSDEMGRQLDESSERLKKKYEKVVISEEKAVRIAREYREHKEYGYINDQKRHTGTAHLKNGHYRYPYEIDWEHPRVRLGWLRLKSDGSVSNGFGKKVLVWTVWFLPVDGIDGEGKRNRVMVDIDAKTGEVFMKYSLLKI